MEKILEVKGLKKNFQKHFWSSGKEILRGLDFFIPKGSVTGILGANGSGKTTTFKCLLQFIKKDEGEVLFFGSTDFNSHIKSRIGFLPEQPCFYEDMNLEELLLFYGRLSDSFSSEELKERVIYLMERVGLSESRFQSLKTFSKGMIQKTGLIQCFLNRPDLVILDEPFSGLDSKGRHYAFSLIEDMRKEGRTVLFSSHVLPDIERLCDRLVILKKGQIIFQGEMEKVMGQLGEKFQIVFMEKGIRKSISGLSLPLCQKELERLLMEKFTVLSVEPEHRGLGEAYKKISGFSDKV